MRDDGVLATNLLSRHRGIDASLARLRAAFDQRAISLPPCASGNVVALAAIGDAVDMTVDSLAARAVALNEETGLDLAPTVSRLARAAAAQSGACW
jgi:spermidine synthase